MALALDNGQYQAVLVALDVIGFDEELQLAVRKMVNTAIPEIRRRAFPSMPPVPVPPVYSDSSAGMYGDITRSNCTGMEADEDSEREMLFTFSEDARTTGMLSE